MRKLSRRDFLASTAGSLLAPAAFGLAGEKAGARRRNALFIFSDQQRKFALGCMGNPNVRTPNLDRLAVAGTLFQNCYSANPVCGPYRCSLFTGRYASATGCWGNGVRLPADGANLPELLERRGVHTSWVGKWHIGGRGNGPIPQEVRGGFTDFIGYQCYNGFYKDVCFYDEAGREHRFERHRTDVTTDLAIERLKRAAAAGKPFAMFVSYQAPHYPEQPSPEFEWLYAGKPMPKRPNYKPVDPYTATIDPPSPKPRENDPDYRRYGANMDEYMRLYNAMCTQIDAGVGRILKALAELGLAEDTLVMYSSDHGDMQGSHGLKNKCLPHEESAGIPFIVRTPGGPRGRSCAVPVSSVDVYPTVLDWLGLDPRQQAGLQGRSLLPYLAGRADLPEVPVYSECVLDGARWHMVRRGRYKLVLKRKNGAGKGSKARKKGKDAGAGAEALSPWLLFDLESAPYEMNNLAQAETHAPVRQELGQLLEEFLKSNPRTGQAG